MRRYFKVLQALGYNLSDVEQLVIAEPRKPRAAKPVENAISDLDDYEPDVGEDEAADTGGDDSDPADS